MKQKIYLTLNVVAINSIIALAISYTTQLIYFIPDLNFLESAGVYCIWIPIHAFFLSFNKK
jgi:hypothetical protein